MTAQLIIHSLPQVRLQPQGSLVKLTGSRLDISCSVSGDPRPTIAWRRMSKWVLLAVWSTRYRDHEFRSIHGHDAKDRLYSHDLCYDLVILSSYHFVILSSCHLVILSFCHLVILSFCHLVILSSCHFVIFRLNISHFLWIFVIFLNFSPNFSMFRQSNLIFKTSFYLNF